MTSDAARKIALQIAWCFHGRPYIWGGDDPMRGFDCSGLVVEILQSVGILARGTDYTAQGLWDLFSTQARNKPYAGCLAIWSIAQGALAHHVELCINDCLSIGASGGGSKTTSEQTAIDQNAYVKVRPFLNRGGYVRFVDPFLKDPLAGTNGRGG